MNIKLALVASDHHFGHDKLAHLRGFNNAETFAQAYVEAHNAVVQKHHAVLFLGDCCMSRESLGIISKLNGSLHLILGNHDRFTQDEYLAAGFTSVSAMQFSATAGVVLTHYPVHPAYFSFRQEKWINLHGHIHTEVLPGPYVNCCIEQSLRPRAIADFLSQQVI
jgi:calcineurin-like phosphoesterase family protein